MSMSSVEVESLDEKPGRANGPQARFIEAMRTRNPFSITSVGDTVEITGDVASIHEGQFHRLIERAIEAHNCREAGRGCLLLGQPGVGKSHLLGRFKTWAEERSACFVYLHNVQVQPDEILRFLVHCCIAKLAEDRVARVHRTDFYEIVRAAVAKAAKELGIASVTPESMDQVGAAIARLFGGNSEVFSVIFRCYCASRAAGESAADGPAQAKQERVVSAAISWLEGDVLDAEEAALIGRKPRPGEATVMMDNQQAEDVIVILARLAQETDRPFILCIDQADMMTDAQLEAFGNVVQSLVNRSRNLCVVVSGVIDSLDRRIREGAIKASAADRIDAGEPIILTRVPIDHARLILATRIERFFESLGSLPRGMKKYRDADPLFPLGERWFDKVTDDTVELRPRDVIQWSRSQWRRQAERIEKLGCAGWLADWEGVPPEPDTIIDEAALQRQIDDAVHAKLDELRNERLFDPSQLPADAGKLRALTLATLSRCRGTSDGRYTLIDVVSPKPGGVDLDVTEMLDGRRVRNAVKFVVTASKTSTSVSLGKLVDAEWADERVLVTVAEKAPLSVAKTGKGAAHLAALRGLGDGRFHDVQLSFEEFADLDSLEAVVGAAASGDLEIDFGPGKPPKRISTDEVVASLHRHKRYLQNRLLSVFLTHDSSPPPPVSKYPEEPPFTTFVRTKLSYMLGASLTEILRKFMANHPPGNACVVSEENAFEQARDIVMKLHEAGIVHARPHGSDLFIQSGAKHA